MRLGHHTEALALADEAIELHELYRDYVYLPGSYEARARILLAQPDPDFERAEADLERGRQLARAQGARAVEHKLVAALKAHKAEHSAAIG